MLRLDPYQRNFKSSSIFLFYLLSILLLTFQINGIVINNTLCATLGPITLFSSEEQIVSCYGAMDVASYVKYAEVLRDHGLVASINKYYFGTWPPGFPFIQMMIQEVGAPIPLALFVITSLLWALVFLKLYSLLVTFMKQPSKYLIFAPLFLLLLPYVTRFYFRDGLLMSEPISTALFTFAVLDIWQSVRLKKKFSFIHTMLLGLLFAISSYIRAQFDIIFHALILAGFILLGLIYIYLRLRDGAIQAFNKQMAVGLISIFLVYQVSVIPYKSFMALSGAGPVLANTTYAFESVWHTEDWLVQNGAGFMAQGGAHAVCEINPDKCKEYAEKRNLGITINAQDYRSEAIKSIISRPVDFILYKWPYFWRSWMQDPYAESIKSIFPVNLNLILFLGVLSLVLAATFSKRIGGELLIFSGLFFGTTVFSLLVHFEARYLYFIKLISLIWIMCNLCNFFDFVREKRLISH